MSYKLYVVPKIATASDLDSYQLSGAQEWAEALVSAVVGGVVGAIVADSIPGPGIPG